MDNGRFLQVPGPTETQTDRYTASIDLSNACRRFYQTQLKAAQGIRSRWERHTHTTSSDDNCRPEDRHSDSGSRSTDNQRRRHRNSIDDAMDRLRTEVASLMEQDLWLMETLLTLNETIEDLKVQRGYYYSRGSLRGSSTDFPHSDCSASDTDVYEWEDKTVHATDSASTAHPANTATLSPAPVVVLTSPLSSSTSTATSSPAPVVVLTSPYASSTSTATLSPAPVVVLPSPSSSSTSTATLSPAPVVVLSSPLSSAASASSSSSCHRKQGGVVYNHGTPEHASYSSGHGVSRGRGGVDCETSSGKACETQEHMKAFHSDQDSFDSGFHEPGSEEEVQNSH